METISPHIIKGLTSQPIKLPENRVRRSCLGGFLLEKLRGHPEPKDSCFPEDWIRSITKARTPGKKVAPDEGLSKILLGDGTGINLKTLLELFPKEMLGEHHYSKFGTELALLVKLLDSKTRLCLQYHPNKEFASRYLSSKFGKTEAWIILETRKLGGIKPYILLGFKPGINKNYFRELFEKQDLERINWLFSPALCETR